jgi:hypothetical protein
MHSPLVRWSHNLSVEIAHGLTLLTKLRRYVVARLRAANRGGFEGLSMPVGLGYPTTLLAPKTPTLWGVSGALRWFGRWIGLKLGKGDDRRGVRPQSLLSPHVIRPGSMSTDVSLEAAPP